jgi:cytochrome d ubiquinol oxidase subunit II
MHLYELPIICVLIGLTLYVVLGGADFGAGLWQLATLVTPARTEKARERAEAIREHAHHSMGPVWEANHVWLIFVLTVTWTAYPRAFGAIASTLEVPLMIAGIGIVFRGAAYALRTASAGAREQALIDTVFSLSSLLTPFALGTMIGALVLGTVPLGDAAGGVWSSWTHPFSLLLGALVVVLCAYMAAVYLAADAARGGQSEQAEQAEQAERTDLAGRFRTRALTAAVAAGALAIALLPVLHADAHRFFTRLVSGPGLIGAIISALGGVGTLGLVLTRRFEAARASAALAVAGLIVGWALAQDPILLPGLTLAQAASPNQTMIALLAAIAAGVVVLFPSLALLFSLQLRGRFDASGAPQPDSAAARPQTVVAVIASARRGIAARGAIAGLLGGLGFLTAADAPWAHIVGVVSLAVCAVCALLAVGPAELAAHEDAD